MDDTLTTQLLSSLLPPEFVTLINTHVLDPNSPFQIIKRQAVMSAQHALTVLLPLVQPLVDRLVLALSEHQGALDVLVPLLVLAAAVVVLNWIRRILMWWTRLAMRAVFWAAVVALVAWVWNRGVLTSARDATIVGGKVVGYMAVVKNIWLDEYKRYEVQQATGRWDDYAQTRGASMYGR